MDSSIITIIIIFGIIIWLLLVIFGIKLCNKNNALGVLILFIPLNIFGLIWGITILYNISNYYRLQREELYDKINKYLDEELKKDKSTQSN